MMGKLTAHTDTRLQGRRRKAMKRSFLSLTYSWASANNDKVMVYVDAELDGETR